MLFKINEGIIVYDRDSIQVLLVAIKAIQEFDQSMNTNGNEDFEKAMGTCKDIIWWVNLASKGRENQHLPLDTPTGMLGRNLNQSKHRWGKD